MKIRRHFTQKIGILMFALLSTNACSINQGALKSEVAMLDNYLTSMATYKIQGDCLVKEIDKNSDNEEKSKIRITIGKFISEDYGTIFSYSKSKNDFGDFYDSSYTSYYVNGYSYYNNDANPNWNAHTNCRAMSLEQFLGYSSFSKEINSGFSKDDFKVKKIRNGGNKVVYKITVKNVDTLFNKITNYEYQNQVELPKTITIKEYTRGLKIEKEATSFNFNTSGKTFNMDFTAYYEYSFSKTLPETVKKAVEQTKIDELLLAGDDEFVEEISYQNQGDFPPLCEESRYPQDENGNNNYYQLLNDYQECVVMYDNTRYIITNAEWSNKLIVYDANDPLKIIYSVIFKYPLNQSIYCNNGQIAISLNLKQRLTPQYTEYRTYSLETFSFLTKGNNVVMSENNSASANASYSTDGLDIDLNKFVFSHSIYLSEKYDAVVYKDKTMVSYLIDNDWYYERYYIYNKEKEQFIARSHLICRSSAQIINENYFFGVRFGKAALIKLE